eukprot:SAG31_NODE_438_length_15693_cov_6.254248_5_plen_132_part_00
MFDSENKGTIDRQHLSAVLYTLGHRLPAAGLQSVLDGLDGGICGPPLTLSDVVGLLRRQPWRSLQQADEIVAEPLLQGLEAALYTGRSGTLHAWGGGQSLPQPGDAPRLPATEFLHAAIGRELRYVPFSRL